MPQVPTLPVSVARPEILLLGLAMILITLLVSRAARHHLSLGRRRLSLVVRTIVLGALVLALAGLRFDLPADRLTTVFVVDLSDSVGNTGRQQGLDYVREALVQRPVGDQAAVVAFGRDALVERLPAELEEIGRIASVPSRSATDIGGALRLASALFPDETQKRIVLISDGNDTTGQGQAEAALAAARGVRVETYQVGLSGATEVMLQSLRTPATARVGEEIDAEVTISSTVTQPATVRLYADGTQVGVQEVDLSAGLTRVTFTLRATEAGFHTFRAVVEAAQDTFGQNDRADSDTVVKGDPRVLLVSDDPIVSSRLSDALATERQRVTLVGSSGVPADLAALASYDSVVLVDVPAQRMGAPAMAGLQAYVRDLGRGLVMIGGEGSYGAGGYSRTPIEATLPVDMEVRDRNREPDIALVVVIDQSGSMDACHCNTANRDRGTAISGIPKVDIGKEAILRAVSALTQRDEFGVVAFNENAHWVISTQPLGNVGDVESRIAGIRADGQTNIFAGLSAAVESLEGSSAERRHIVLLTDGWSSSGAYEDLLRRMKAANITLSAVGAGGGGASDFLDDLAQQGGGRYWSALDASTIPDIFLRETQRAAGQQIIEEAFFPVQTGDSPILRGLDQGMPQLLGYNGSTIKPAAQSVLVTGRDDPLLAQWQYGLGRAVAWTSDASGRWARDWLAWDGFERFFSQAVSWTFPGEESGGIEAEFITDGDQTRLRVTSTDTDGSARDLYQTLARLTYPGMEPRSVDLDQVAPGVYETALGTLEPGAYALRVDQTRSGETPLGRTLVLVAPTPAEYRLLGTNDRLLAALRGATGGEALAGETAAVAAWDHGLAGTTSARELWPWLLVLALLLWPLDVGLRRVSVGRRDVAMARGWLAERWARRGRAAPREAPAAAMLATRARAGGARTRTALFGASEASTATAAAPTPTDVTAPATTTPNGTPSVAQTPVAPTPVAHVAPSQDPAPPVAPDPAPPVAPDPAPPTAPDPAPPTAPAPTTAAAPADTMARLREAKQRARR